MVPYQQIDVNAPFSAAFLDHGMAWAAKIVSLGAVLGEGAWLRHVRMDRRAWQGLRTQAPLRALSAECTPTSLPRPVAKPMNRHCAAAAGIVTSSMTGLLGQSRLFVVLGRERLLPARLANVSSRTGEQDGGQPVRISECPASEKAATSCTASRPTHPSRHLHH